MVRGALKIVFVSHWGGSAGSQDASRYRIRRLEESLSTELSACNVGAI
jgi:hypothetical protein